MNGWVSEEEYKTIVKNVPICCVDLVIRNNEGKVLLVKRKNHPLKGEWCVPGGRILRGEKIKDAAKRKAKDELGLDLEVKDKIGTYELFFEKSAHGPEIGAHSICIAVETTPTNSEEITLDGDHSEYEFFDKIEEDWHPYVKEIIKKSGNDTNS